MLKVLEDFGACNTLITDFITFDIETYKLNNKLIPYLICAYNGTGYITSFNDNVYKLFNNFIKDLLTFIKNDNKTITVYAHNFSSFDGVFLLNHLLPFGNVEPLLHNGKIISIKLTILIEGDSESYNELSKYNGKTIIFKDSFLLLPISLRKLALTYKCTQIKGIFPYKLYDIFYSGTFPKFEYFTDINIIDYTNLSQTFNNKIWNFKQESIKYCKLDCLILHEILTQFNQLIFNEFKVNIHKVLTLPALAMRIYKTHFLPEDKVYQLHGIIEQNIRKSYTGGAVDVYIPHNIINNIEYQTLYCYDVNALYPTMMANKLMPIGKPFAFEGDITKARCEAHFNALGFFYCEITSPTFLNHPILQQRFKTYQGIRTIAGLGTWFGWIFSQEMYNAMKFGYTFKILKGYLFDKAIIFKEYVETMYKLRMLYDKGTPMNDTGKLLNNSLYGKFGMKDEITKMEILENITSEDQAHINSILDVYSSKIIDMIDLEKHTLLIRKSENDLNYNKYDDFYHGSEVNVAIASAITAYARIHMSQFKNNPDFNLYYSDTDSIFTDKPLSDNLVGTSLGQLKLEYVIKKAVFLAPKVYALITEDGKEIIKVKGLTNEVIKK